MEVKSSLDIRNVSGDGNAAQEKKNGNIVHDTPNSLGKLYFINVQAKLVFFSIQKPI